VLTNQNLYECHVTACLSIRLLRETIGLSFFASFFSLSFPAIERQVLENKKIKIKIFKQKQQLDATMAGANPLPVNVRPRLANLGL
jgi:hypothetical protein